METVFYWDNFSCFEKKFSDIFLSWADNCHYKNICKQLSIKNNPELKFATWDTEFINFLIGFQVLAVHVCSQLYMIG